MKKLCILVLILLTTFSAAANAGSSTITEVEGRSCQGDDKSRQQTEKEAMQQARNTALTNVAIYIEAQTTIKNDLMEKDIIQSYANGKVRILSELEKEWYIDPTSGQCYRVHVQAEVFPDEEAVQRIAQKNKAPDGNPGGPLDVRIWTGKSEFKAGETMKVYLSGNKPFFARVVYKMANGEHVQLLPNPFRLDHYFNGGATYELPSGLDRYSMVVGQPFGAESVTVYASTKNLASLDTTSMGALYAVNTKSTDIPLRLRGIALKSTTTNAGGDWGTAEFSENTVEFKTSE